VMTNTEWARWPKAMREREAKLFYERAEGIVAEQSRQFLMKRPARSVTAHVFLANCWQALHAGIEQAGHPFPPVVLAVDLGEPNLGQVLFQVPLHAHDCDECKYLGQIAVLTSLDIDPELDVVAVLVEHEAMRVQLERLSNATTSGGTSAGIEADVAEDLLEKVKRRVPDPADAYVCRKAGYDSLILRHSDEPSDYSTLPIGLHPDDDFNGAHPAFQMAIGRLGMVR
jgi:hypothetical protein